MEKEITKAGRVWLNHEKHEDTGWAAYTIEYSLGGSWVTSELQIHDCSRGICLEFGFDTGTKEQRLLKVDTFIKLLTEFRVDLEAMNPDPKKEGVDKYTGLYQTHPSKWWQFWK